MSLTKCAQCGNQLGNINFNYDVIFTGAKQHESNRVLCSRPCMIAFLQALREEE